MTLCDPMDCSLPGSSVHGIFQARVLEWVAISFFRRSSWPRDRTQVSCIVGDPLPSETPGKSDKDQGACISLIRSQLVSWWILSNLLRNLYAGQEATVRTGHGTDWFQIEKGVGQGCILSPCLFNLYAEYIMRSTRRKKHKLESRLPGEISRTSDMQMTPPLRQKVKRN